MLVEQVNLDDERRDMTDGRFYAATYNFTGNNLEIIKKTEYKKIAYVTDCWTYLSGYRACCRRLF